jgi:hypothetical protein
LVKDGRWVLLPLDCHPEWGGEFHDILDNSLFEDLLRLAKAKRIAVGHGAPPCSLYSLLRTRPLPGRPGLCAPVVDREHMQGLPNLSPYMKNELILSKTIHLRVSLVLTEIILAGGQSSWEQPPSALSLFEECNMKLLQLLPYSATVSWCAVVSTNPRYQKEWLFRSSAKEASSNWTPPARETTLTKGSEAFKTRRGPGFRVQQQNILWSSANNTVWPSAHIFQEEAATSMFRGMKEHSGRNSRLLHRHRHA